MKRSRFSETQVVKILKQHEAGVSVTELCKEHGISAATFYNWKGKYGGMDASQLKKLREIESELSRYKQTCLPAGRCMPSWPTRTTP
jgi:putative transposase